MIDKTEMERKWKKEGIVEIKIERGERERGAERQGIEREREAGKEMGEKKREREKKKWARDKTFSCENVNKYHPRKNFNLYFISYQLLWRDNPIRYAMRLRVPLPRAILGQYSYPIVIPPKTWNTAHIVGRSDAFCNISISHDYS